MRNHIFIVVSKSSPIEVFFTFQANESIQELSGAVHIRVPVVATVVPRVSPGGLLELAIEEPQLKYYTAVKTDSEFLDIKSNHLK